MRSRGIALATAVMVVVVPTVAVSCSTGVDPDANAPSAATAPAVAGVRPPTGPDEVAPVRSTTPDPTRLELDSSATTEALTILGTSWFWDEIGDPAFSTNHAQELEPGLILLSVRLDELAAFTAEMPYSRSKADVDRTLLLPPAVRPTCVPFGYEDSVVSFTLPTIAENLRIVEATVDLRSACVVNVSLPPGSDRESTTDPANPADFSVRRPDGYVGYPTGENN